jgi:hypothetical protein
MTVDTVAAGDRGKPTAACNHVAIDETTVSASGISEESNCVHAGARDTVVPDGPIVLRLAELNFLDINVAGDDHPLWRGLDDAELDVVSLDCMAALDIPWKSDGPITLRQVAGPPISAELISLPIRVANPEPGGVNNTEYVTIRAAGCRQMTHDIILCAPNCLAVNRSAQYSVSLE